MFSNLKQKLNDKSGVEILQTLIIIAVVGAIAIVMVYTFKNEIYKSVGPKIKDSTYDYMEDDKNIGAALASDTRYREKNTINYNQ